MTMYNPSTGSKTNDELKAELKKVLTDSLYYIVNDSPLKKYHEDVYQKTIKEFNLILAREAK